MDLCFRMVRDCVYCRHDKYGIADYHGNTIIAMGSDYHHSNTPEQNQQVNI